MAARMFDEDDDEVVGEVDIYLSQPKPNCELHVLQYPLRNAKIGIGSDRRVTAVNVRPRHGRIEVKLAVRPDNPEPEEVTSAEGCGKSFDLAQERAEEKAIGNVQCLRSRPNRAAPDSNYAIGCYVPPGKNDARKPSFTLVPVRSVSQLRPAFDYLDEHDMQIARQRADEKAARAHVRGETRAPEEAEDVAPLQVSFRRRETERAVERRKNSHATLRQREEGEAWLPVAFVPEALPDAQERRRGLFSPALSTVAPPVKEEAAFDADMHYEDLYRAHTRHVHLGVVAKGSTDREPLSTRALKRLPVDAAVAQIMSHARLVRFQHLVDGVAEGTPTGEVLNATRIAAMCLRGCWVAKKGEKVGRGKQKAMVDRYDASRMLILNLFRQDRVVSAARACEELGERMLIDAASVEKILKEVSVRKRGYGWEFRLDDDDGFKYDYPELVDLQNEDWDRRVAASREMLAKVKK